MIPVDALIWTEPVFAAMASAWSRCWAKSTAAAGVKIALIDASRRNPFERRFRSFHGLAPVIAPNGTLVMYSAALSSVISDNGSDHSLFVQELLKDRVPDLMAEETLNRTRVGYTRASRSEQVPWISSSLAEDFSFIPGSGSGTKPPGSVAALPRPAPEPPPLPRVDPVLPPPPKQVELKIPSPEKPVIDKPVLDKPAADKPAADKPPEKIDGTTALALADDPTIKSLTTKLADNPDDAGALYRRGQVYASKGAYNLALKDFVPRCG
jgi:hypothetical protein